MNFSLRLGNSSIRLMTSLADSLARRGLSILISLMSFSLLAMFLSKPEFDLCDSSTL